MSNVSVNAAAPTLASPEASVKVLIHQISTALMRIDTSLEAIPEFPDLPKCRHVQEWLECSVEKLRELYSLFLRDSRQYIEQLNGERQVSVQAMVEQASTKYEQGILRLSAMNEQLNVHEDALVRRETAEALTAAEETVSRLERQLLEATTTIDDLQKQLLEERSKAQAEKTAAVAAHRQAVAALKQKQDGERKAWENERKTTVNRHLEAMERADERRRQLERSALQAEDYARSIEEHERRLLDARDRMQAVRAALDAAEAENVGLKETIDRLTAVNLGLQDELAGERSRVNGLPNQGIASATRARPRDEEAMKKFQDAVYVTLCSRYEGYSDLGLLLRHLDVDYGFKGEETSRALGYASFRDFLESSEMATALRVDKLTVYKAISRGYADHILVEQETSAESMPAKIAKLKRHLNAEKQRTSNLRQDLEAQNIELEELRSRWNCPICMERHCDAAFICRTANGPHGHIACYQCAEQWREQRNGCHSCREPISELVKLT